jgi:hypothetical protein
VQGTWEEQIRQELLALHDFEVLPR